MALTGSETIVTQTASGSVISSVQSTTRGIAMLGNAIPARVSTPIATVGAGTLTAAALIGGAIVRSGSTSAFTDTCDTAANIIAALPVETPTNFSWLVYLRNTTAFPETLAGAAGITLSGENVVPPNSTGLFIVTLTGPAAISVNGILSVPSDLGVLVANTALSTVGAGTLTAAAITGGLITRSGSTSAFTDTSDTAANIIAALPNAQVGQSFPLEITNTTAFPETIAGGAGVTVSGLAGPIPANSTAKFLVTYTGAAAVSMQMTGLYYNAANGFDPSTVQTQFGSATTSPFLEEGTLGKSISGAGINPGGTGGDYVLAVFTIPASAFDGIGNRGLTVLAKGGLGATANTKRLKVIANPTSAVVGSLISGGTTVEDTTALAVNGGGWLISVDIFKYGAAASNTQVATSNGKIMGSNISTAHLGCQAPTLLTATESGAILVAITGNAATLASDISLNTAYATAMN